MNPLVFPAGALDQLLRALAACDGCQFTLLNCEDELLALAGLVQVANFPEASREVLPGPYDISLVEGSIATPGDEQRIRQVREMSRYLVTIGACATAGGVQALRNAAGTDLAPLVYPSPRYLDTRICGICPVAYQRSATSAPAASTAPRRSASSRRSSSATTTRASPARPTSST